MDFTFSDLIAGYVESFDRNTDIITMKTSDNRTYQVQLTGTTTGELMRNLGEAFKDSTSALRDLLFPHAYLYIYGIYYPETNHIDFEAKRILFCGRYETEYVFEKPRWWIHQVTRLADFYLKAQFGDGPIDYRNYRTDITLIGVQSGGLRQETDTISRLVYGFSVAYMLTGNETYLEAATKGAFYLRDNLRGMDSTEDIVYWYHALDRTGDRVKKVFASEGGDENLSIPLYEQIYALAGPTMVYRITGNAKLFHDIQRTVNFFNRYFKDNKQGGYFSHVDPVTFSPYAASLKDDKARKNWNSIGDHAPAYLINLFLATGDGQYGSMLEYVGDLIEKYFPDYGSSPFVQEKFFEDWTHDKQWKWQQDRGVVGHNLKIAWNMIRMYNQFNKESFKDLSVKISQIMPTVGFDRQRGGWYDVMERHHKDDQQWHRFTWHDRKAWWQQEQGILAFLILSGSLRDGSYRRLARESSGFYNAWFLDHDSGGVYFNVLANGIPFLLGTERSKGSHAMSGYHSFELAFLAAVYTNLLITKHPLDLYFKPEPRAFPKGILRVAPDILPKGSVRIESVLIDDKDYENFDPEALTVTLPETAQQVKVRVRLAPTGGLDYFSAESEQRGAATAIVLTGKLDANAVPVVRATLQETIATAPLRLALIMDDLAFLSREGALTIVFEMQKLPPGKPVFVVGAKAQVKDMLDSADFLDSVTLLDTYDKNTIEGP